MNSHEKFWRTVLLTDESRQESSQLEAEGLVNASLLFQRIHKQTLAHQVVT